MGDIRARVAQEFQFLLSQDENPWVGFFSVLISKEPNGGLKPTITMLHDGTPRNTRELEDEAKAALNTLFDVLSRMFGE
jgi:hypothetical protein